MKKASTAITFMILLLSPFNAAGFVPVGGEFQVNTFTQGAQIRPSVAMAANGNFVIAWSSLDQDGSGFGIFIQHFDRSGIALGGEVRVNSVTASDQILPSVAMDATGNSVVAWGSCAFR